MGWEGLPRTTDPATLPPEIADYTDSTLVHLQIQFPPTGHSTGRGCRVGLPVCGGFVADDVDAGKSVWGDEAVVEVVAWQPAVAGPG